MIVRIVTLYQWNGKTIQNIEVESVADLIKILNEVLIFGYGLQRIKLMKE